ncbi:MAG: hypothetical protein K8F52_17885 [Candidatus Scalindua rubra]|uniref:Uncharacterized protein n=1 Tax=Candidatus Scalindua brodae TaxID=237368 RepID=A0A0B0EN27_9BACT|nr:MAG: hypothetical protein SCABRO_00172 [Candidatus Scalindua brodae]MBZ0110527.1 hypothetical protein [Candidatus Scalindua rubra]
MNKKRLGNNEQAGNKVISNHTIRDRLYVFISDCMDAIYLTVIFLDNEGTPKRELTTQRCPTRRGDS